MEVEEEKRRRRKKNKKGEGRRGEERGGGGGENDKAENIRIKICKSHLKTGVNCQNAPTLNKPENKTY